MLHSLSTRKPSFARACRLRLPKCRRATQSRVCRSRRPPGEPLMLGSRLYSVSLYLAWRWICSLRLAR
ncbi:hypothetical protein D9M72_531050 [compost metagenome]